MGAAFLSTRLQTQSSDVRHIPHPWPGYLLPRRIRAPHPPQPGHLLHRPISGERRSRARASCCCWARPGATTPRRCHGPAPSRHLPTGAPMGRPMFECASLPTAAGYRADACQPASSSEPADHRPACRHSLGTRTGPLPMAGGPLDGGSVGGWATRPRPPCPCPQGWPTRAAPRSSTGTPWRTAPCRRHRH